jgi:two-component system CheB/CheR fusion protein
VIEDDPEVSDLLTLFLREEGHRVVTAPHGVAALESIARGEIRPDLVLADFNLPNGMDGLQIAAKLRERLNTLLPVIILTGDISTATLRNIAMERCAQLNKPVKLKELTQAIQRFLPPTPPASSPVTEKIRPVAADPGAPVVFIVDDDNPLRAVIREVLEADGRAVEDYDTCEAFLAAYRPGREECLLIDAYLPGMNGLELIQHLRDAGHKLPAVMITGRSDVSMAVEAMKAGASDFIEKPVRGDELLAIVKRAFAQSRDSSKQFAWREAAASHIADLTPRQREIMELVLAGHPSKNIAADLGVSQRTVENHRAAIMKKTGSKSLPALARLALAAL